MSESYEPWPANYVWRSSRPTRNTPPPTDPYGPVATGELRDESQVVMFPTNGERPKGIGTVDGLQAFAGHIPFEAVIPVTAGLAALQGESQ